MKLAKLATTWTKGSIDSFVVDTMPKADVRSCRRPSKVPRSKGIQKPPPVVASTVNPRETGGASKEGPPAEAPPAEAPSVEELMKMEANEMLKDAQKRHVSAWHCIHGLSLIHI